MDTRAPRGELPRIAVIGTGLVGGSIGLAAARRGATVAGWDVDPARLARAAELGAVQPARSLAAAVRDARCVFVCVPVAAVAEVVVAALDAGDAVVTDVGSVKAPVVAEVARARGSGAARFVGGHPMAGSEQDGIDGADADLFVGATWVLTPTATTDPDAFADLRRIVGLLEAEVLAVAPEHHDTLVALVSHVPQLAATTLMDVAGQRSEEHRPLLRLAAGGFRDMTRIAAGHPGIWPDIFSTNRDAVLAALDVYLAALAEVREVVARGDRQTLLATMERARVARRNLPVGLPADAVMVELRIPVPDRPGVLAEVTTLAGELGVNVADLEIAHSVEGSGGVLVLTVPEAGASALEQVLHEHGFHTSRTVLP